MSGPFGFQDWQRFSGWDSPVLVSDNAVARSQFFHLGPFDVRQWARLAGKIRINQPCFVDFIWYADQGATVQVADRACMVDGVQMGSDFVFSIPNQGPWVSIWFSTIAAGCTETAYIFATNRPASYEITPTQMQLAVVNAQNVAGGGNFFSWFQTYWSGPARLWTFCAQPLQWAIQRDLDTAGALLYVSEGTSPAGVDFRDEVYIPPAPCRLLLINTGAAAANVYATLIPSAGVPG